MRYGKTIGNVALAVIVLSCLAVLAISVYPGVLNDFLFFAILLAFFVIPIVTIIGLVTLFVLARHGKLKGVTIPWKRVGVVVTILFGTFVLLQFYVPRRIAFSVSRSAFERLVSQAPESHYQGTPLNRRLGLYRVDEYAADPRGGVYFRVYRGTDGIGPDCMSYGFVYTPNAKGTPFGASQYELFGLGNDWYWFHVSDDWY